MRALVLMVVGSLLPACIYYDPNPPAEQADAIVFYPPDARIDAMPDAAIDIANCANELPCPEAGPNRVSVCGRIHDAETGAPIAPGIVGEVCRPGFTDGACALDIQAYDALAYAGDTTIAPQPYEDKYLDTCGRFQLVDVLRPQSTYLGLGIDDVEGGPDDYGIGGAAMATSSGLRIAGFQAYAIRHTTDASWTAAAGLTGDSFVERGVVLMTFHDETGAPADGVTVTEGAGPEVANDFYFSDTDPAIRRTIDVDQDVTGLNGSALKINSGLVEHSGTGGGCTWTSGLATGIRGVMLYAERECQ